MKNKKKILHIIIIILGIAFIGISAFHSNIWFDEAYSVGIAKYSYSEIWTIGGHDVHPILYYWILHTISLIGGSNILLYRLFSVSMLAVLGILGYTHIRKDFGENVGILFSFFVFFLPVNLVYAGEIRMYSLAMLLVTLTAIYAYRIYQNTEKRNFKNWILFAVFSLASAYTHYYGLMAVGVINILLFIPLMIQVIKNKKISYSLKAFSVSAIFQIIAYLPWILYLFIQLKHVSNGFWIAVKFPDTLINLFIFQFTGNLDGTAYIGNVWAGLFGILICMYLIYLWFKNRKKEKTEKEKLESQPAKFAIGIYSSIILVAYLISIIWKPVLYPRYLLCITGILIFFFAYRMAKRGNKHIILAIGSISVMIAIIININLITVNYDKSNQEPFTYLKENLQSTDIVLHGNEETGFIISTNYPNNKEYFWNRFHWNVEDAYKAFAKEIETIYSLDETKQKVGRILIVDTENYDILNQIQENDSINIIDKREFKTIYKNYSYNFVIIEKY